MNTNRRAQSGMAVVEFALVAPVAFIVLFGCIEIGRALFVWNTVVEATRRGARVATVTDPATPDAVRNAVLTYAASLDHMTAANVTVTYYQADGTTVTTSMNNAAFVTVSTTGLTHSLLIPYVGRNIAIPAFATTLPTESAGFVPS